MVEKNGKLHDKYPTDNGDGKRFSLCQSSLLQFQATRAANFACNAVKIKISI